MEESKIIPANLKMVSEINWKNLSEKRIYFGHQSVGFNIVDGIKDVLKEHQGIRLNIVETNNTSDFNAPIFAHSRVGQNSDITSKCQAFIDIVENGVGDRSDMAFFKFCFLDVTEGTDVEKMFGEYKRTLSLLEQKYPRTVFVHVTVPLTTVQTGVKVWIKKLIGKSVYGYDDNIKRNQFNQRLKEEYQGKQPIFDLAAFESTLPDGRQALFTSGGKTYFSLAREYTRDGGHLNPLGRKMIAEQFLTFLANSIY